jgi:hypothetical protein
MFGTKATRRRYYEENCKGQNGKQQFNFEGVTYIFDAIKCYYLSGLIKLPDNRVLRVGGWFECSPPSPSGLSLVEQQTTFLESDADDEPIPAEVGKLW